MGVLKPPPSLPLSTWIEQTLRLPEGTTALPGPVRLYPYQREIADAIGDPEIERVTLVKPVRVGFTMLLASAIASFVANEPAPILVLQPTESDARDFTVSDLEPLFSSTPALAGLLTIGGNKSGERSTILSRRFPGGSLKIVASKAPRNLRRHTSKVLLIDEADAMQPSPEGSPLVLAERRTLSFADRKIVLGSTPLNVETSNVLRAYARSDQRIFEVPCPSCGAFTEILWRHIEWEPSRPETAAFRCPHCNALIDERHKFEMVAAGRWRATAPDVVGHAGFKLNALVSLLANAAWSKLVEEFIRAKNDSDDLKAFTNTILGEGWQDEGEELDETDVSARATRFPAGTIPTDVLSVTSGLDVQDDRAEISYCGWARDGTCYVLDHTVIYGDPAKQSFWQDVDDALKVKWRHPWGGTLVIDVTCVDSGGHFTDQVYSFCFPRSSRRIMAIKGLDGSRQVIVASKSKTRGGRLFLVGVDPIKTQLINRLTQGQSIKFSDALESEYFQQLCSEKRVVRYSRGQPTIRFERKTGYKAEALDCWVYAFAAFKSLHLQLDQRENDLKQKPRPVPKNKDERTWIGETKENWI